MKIGLYIGTEADTTNQYSERLLLGWGKCLSDHQVDAFGASDLPASATDYYNRVETKARGYRTPFTKIITTYRGAHEYASVHDPDVLVQFRSFSTHATGIALAGRDLEIPVITRFPSDAFQEYRMASGIRKGGLFLLHNVFGRLPLALSEATIVLGPYGQSEVEKRGVSSDDVVIIPPPKDVTGRFRPADEVGSLRDELGLPQDRRIALFVGKMTELKGMEFARSVIQSTSERSDIYFVFIGPGPYRQRLRSEFSSDTVELPGHIPYSEIHDYYRAADVYIHPSPHEGIPLSVLEALDCGTPVVARRAGDIAYVTPNVVDTPEEMVDCLIAGNKDATWLHEAEFTMAVQQEKLNSLLERIKER